MEVGAVKEIKPRDEAKSQRVGLRLRRHFTEPGASPYDAVTWELRTASISSDKGEVVFEQKNVEVPSTWSQLATNIAASKYFHGHMGTPGREHSIRQLVGRVVDTVTEWGLKGNYFKSAEDAAIFSDELAHLLLTQKAAFNSPVWFNVGIEPHPQASACFINSVDDTMPSILDLAKTEGMLFKYGSGTGTNFSAIRSSREKLSTGGIASGPVSFMRGFDAFAGVIKSGGRTRRAAKMVILNIDHPDIEEFITCKSKEERKAWTLIDHGYDGSLTGDAYSSVFFQNANHSVRVSDTFMHAVEKNEEWVTRAVTNGQPMDRYKARDLLRMIADSTYLCGDPGMQYDDIINRWHTCKTTGRINASNPCSEYMFLDDTACNLASLNLMKFVGGDGQFDVQGFREACATLITAQEILVDSASYPTPRISVNSHEYRPLGLGYANLGALLMYNGIPYDSDKGRDFAAAITALMTGQAYLRSAEIARELGVFPGFEKNRKPMLEVIARHRDAVQSIDPSNVPADLCVATGEVWDQALELGRQYGYKNAQATVLAPTGTIGLMMDCDTTGVEPDLALIKFKKLVGGGLMRIVNGTVPAALKRLGYSAEETAEIVAYIDRKGTMEGAPHLQSPHLSVFDCAFRTPNGARAIHHMGHVKMMAAVQPFISGAISKTVNVPADCTVEEIMQTYVEAWKLGLKSIAIYRDGSKRTQPLNTTSSTTTETTSEKVVYKPVRRKLPTERKAITHKFRIGGHEGYITVGMFDDGAPGEIFLVMAKEGSTISGLMDSFATAISMALQYGVPIKALIDKFSHVRFEPSGFTGHPEIPMAKSIMDYIFRWLALKFLPADERARIGIVTPEGLSLPSTESTKTVTDPLAENLFLYQTDAPSCSDCGAIMVRSGTCYKCLNCGETSGCS
ncbi:MAG: vitamin B12-dependent ribonucleotide reductase [Acidobacteria bacterium]|nr:vitamin B12-dependent ribonucleotide reductase [Acidobacteriota bacterium]MBI3657894.1 vitamin B12-dependent ribonucleotide reductase [Acidobacteriota bacterium]